jgi:hypothetical protein
MTWRDRTLAVLVVAAAVLGGCVHDERQWMKLDASYTRQDFERDWAACTRNGKVDEACMRNLGWVAVNPGGTAEKPKDPHARDLMPPSARGDRRY